MFYRTRQHDSKIHPKEKCTTHAKNILIKMNSERGIALSTNKTTNKDTVIKIV